MNFFSLEGKVALVIGGTRGIGEGIATGLSEAGADVVIVSRHQDGSDEAAKRITEYTHRETFGMVADVASRESVETLVKEVWEKFGHIDILVNGAGVNIRKDTIEVSEEEWDHVQNDQLKGTFFACQTVGRYMIENGIKGKIINISSIDSLVVSQSNIISYMAAKGAITQITKSLAVEWAEKGICVNAIAPGYFQTVMTKPLFENKVIREQLLSNIPQKRFGSPYKDIAGLAIYLASDSSNYTTGQSICVDGGYTLV